MSAARRNPGRAIGAALLLAACSEEQQAPPAAAAPAASSAEAPAATPEPAAAPAALQDVLLITLDTTRADRLGCYGHAGARTPWLDRLASEGVRFTNARSAAPITLPSHATLLTGCDPVTHGVRDNGLYSLDEKVTTLAEALRGKGWQTAAFVGSFVLDARFGLAQGFATYEGPQPDGLGAQPEVIERPASAVVDDAIAWLARARPEKPFFLWVHLYDPHAPYAPPVTAAGALPDKYDGEIASCDAQLARLHAELRKRGRADSLLEFVTADHGEAFGAHGETTHGLLLHDATMRVPLLARGPGIAAGATIALPVSNGSIATTVLARLGLPAGLLPDARLRPLPLDAAAESAAEPAALLLETWMPMHAHRWSPLRALVVGDAKLVSGAYDELFDLAADPGEEADLAKKEPARAAKLRALLEARFDEARGAGAVERVLTEDERAKLKAAGYVVDGAAATEASSLTLPDPRQSITDESGQQAAIELFKQGRALLGQDALLQGRDAPGVDPAKKARGRRMLERALNDLLSLEAGHPDDPSLAFDLGNVYLSLGKPEEAFVRFEVAVSAEPTNALRHYNLAIAYAGVKQMEWAIAEMEKAIHCEPRLLFAYRWLVDAHDKRKEIGRAAWWLEKLAEQGIVPPSERAGFMQMRMMMDQKLKQSGQRPVAPPNFPPKDLRPAGILDRH